MPADDIATLVTRDPSLARHREHLAAVAQQIPEQICGALRVLGNVNGVLLVTPTRFVHVSDDGTPIVMAFREVHGFRGGPSRKKSFGRKDYGAVTVKTDKGEYNFLLTGDPDVEASWFGTAKQLYSSWRLANT